MEWKPAAGHHPNIQGGNGDWNEAPGAPCLQCTMPVLLCCQVWEVFLVRRLLSEAVLYPVAAIEPVLSLTCLSLALIYLHTCLR